MKCTIDRETAVSLLDDLVRIAPPRSTLPILQSVHVEAADGFVMFTATDLDRLMRLKMSATVDECGTFAVDCRTLAEALGMMTEPDVHFLVNEHARTADITCGTDYIKLNGDDAGEFPVIPDEVPVSDSAVIFQDDNGLHNVVKTVKFAVDDDATRPVLMTVKVAFVGGVAEFAATDGFVLAQTRVEMLYPSALEGTSVNLPTYILDAFLMAMRRAGSSWLTVDWDTNNVNLATDAGDFVVGTIDRMNFPDYSPILKKNKRQMVTVETKRFLQAVRLARVIGQHATQHALVLSAEEDAGDGAQFKMASSADKVGDSAAYVSNPQVSGQAEAVAVNGEYLENTIKACPADKMTIWIDDPHTAVHLEAQTGGMKWHAVIMPIGLRR